MVMMTPDGSISETTARVLIAEIGTDMTRFPSVGHLISWAASARGWMKARAIGAPHARGRAPRGSNPP
jgi:hypothetical protein